MSNKYLTNIELVRFAALPRGEERDKAILDFITGMPRWGYQPARAYLIDILNVSSPLMPMPDMQWREIEDRILKKCSDFKDPDVAQQQREYNVGKGEELYSLRHQLNWKFLDYNIKAALYLPDQRSLSYWHNTLGIDKDGAFLPFIDFRSNSGLNTKESRKLVFSIQNQLVIEQDLDLEGARPAIIRIEGNLKKGLKPVYYFNNGEDLYSLADIETKTLEVYEDFERVKHGLPDEGKKTGTND